MTTNQTPAARCLQKGVQGLFWMTVIATLYVLAHVPGAIVEMLLG